MDDLPPPAHDLSRDTRPVRSLRRSLDDRVIGGVSGGLGEYFDIDPTLVRLAWVAFTLLGGWGVPLYLLAWIVVPDAAGRRASLPVALLVLLFAGPALCMCMMLMTGALGDLR
jgi:phage shock protein PspC (stress-responsive transcriptional regulator)